MNQWDTSRAGIPPDPGGSTMAGSQQNPMGQPVSQNGTSTTTQGRREFTHVDVAEPMGKAIIKAAFSSYIDTTYCRHWEVDRIVMINNQRLSDEYNTKRLEMTLQYPSIQGKKAEELKESCMFCCLASDKAMEDIAEHGYRVNPNAGSYIGDCMKGVILSHHADIQLKMAELVITESDTCWLVLFKVIIGKCRWITDQAVQGGKVDVQPGYDSHRFTVTPKTGQGLSEQALRNQVTQLYYSGLGLKEQAEQSQAFFFEYVSAGVTSPRPRHVLPYFALKLKRLPLGGSNLQQNVQVAAAVQNVQLTQAVPNVQLAVQSARSSAQVNAPATRSALNNMSTTQLPFRQSAFDQQANTPSFLNQQTHLVMRSGVLKERNTLPELQPRTLPGQRAVLNPVANESGQQIMWNNAVASQGVQQSALLAQQLSMSNTTASRTALSAAIVARERLLHNLQTQAIQRSQRSAPNASLGWMQHQAPTSQVQSSVHSAFPRTQSRNPASSTIAAGVVNRRLSNTNLYVTPIDQCTHSGDVQSQGTPSTPDLSYSRFVLRANPAKTEPSRVSVASLGGLSGGTCVSYTPGKQVGTARSVASPTMVTSPIGMRLPTVIPPDTEPDGSHIIIQPIVIQPTSDVMPSFLRTSPHDEFSDGANVFPTDTGALDGTMQSAVFGSAMDESEAVAAAYLSISPSHLLTNVNDVSVEQPVYSEVSVEQPACTETLVGQATCSGLPMEQAARSETSMEHASCPETLVGQAVCSGLPMEQPACSETLVGQATSSGLPMEQPAYLEPSVEQATCSETPMEQAACSETLVEQATCSNVSIEQAACSDRSVEQACSEIAMECTERISTGFSGNIIGTVSEVSQSDVAHANENQSSDEQLPELLQVTTDDRTASTVVSRDNAPAKGNRSFDEILYDMLNDDLAVSDDEDSCDDRLGSMQCDIDSGREILSTPRVDTTGDVVSHDSSDSATVNTTGGVVSHDSSDSATVGTTGGVVSHDICDSATVDTTGGVVSNGSSDSAKSVTEDKPNDSSHIYLQKDGSLELVIKQRVSGSSSSKGSVTSDSLRRLLKPVNDAANWRRFLTDKRFQPVVVLRRLRNVPHSTSSSVRHDKKKRHHSHHSHVSKSQDIATEDIEEVQDGREYAKRHKKHKHKKEKRHGTTQAVGKKRTGDVVKRHSKHAKLAGNAESRPYDPKFHAEKLSPTSKPWRSCIRVSNGEAPSMWKMVDAKLRHGRNHNMFGTWKQNSPRKGAVGPTFASGESSHKSPKSHRKTLSGIRGHAKRVSNDDKCVKTKECVSEPAKGAIDRVSWFSQARRDDCQKKLIVLDAPGGKEPCCKPVSKPRRSTDGALPATGEQQNPRRSSCSALVDAGVRNRIGSDINRKTPSNHDGKRTISLSRYRDDCAKKRLQESEGGPYAKRVSWAVQETDAGVGSTADTTRGIRTSTVSGCSGEMAGNSSKGYAPPVSTSVSCHNASPSLHSSRSPSISRPTSILSHKLPCTRNTPKPSPHKALAQDGGIAAAFLMGRGHQKQTASGGNVPPSVGNVPPSVGNVPPSDGNVPPSGGNVPPSVGNVPPSVGNVPSSVGNVPPSDGNVPPIAELERRSRHGSGHADLTVARNSPKTSSHEALAQDGGIAAAYLQSRGHQPQTASRGNVPTIAEVEARSRHGSARVDLSVAPEVCVADKGDSEGHALPATTSSVACHNMPPSVNSSHISGRNSPTSVWSQKQPCARNSPKTSSHEALAQDGGIAEAYLLSRGQRKQSASGGNIPTITEVEARLRHSSGGHADLTIEREVCGRNLDRVTDSLEKSDTTVHAKVVTTLDPLPASTSSVACHNMPLSVHSSHISSRNSPTSVWSHKPPCARNSPKMSPHEAAATDDDIAAAYLPSRGHQKHTASHGNIPPSGGNIPPSGGNMLPSGGNMLPSGGNVLFSGGNVPPMGGNMSPSGGITALSDGNKPPSGGNMKPSAGNIPPSGGNVPPSGGNIPPIAELKVRSRHGSGHADSSVVPEVCSPDPDCVADEETECDKAWVLTELTIDASAAVETYTQRRQDSDLDSAVDLPHKQDSNLDGTVDPRLLGIKRVPRDEESLWRTAVEFGTPRTGSTAVDQHTIAAAASAMSPKGSPSYPDDSMLELAHCEKELLASVDTPPGTWNTSRLSNPAVLKIVNEYSRKPHQERHQMMLIYSAKIRKMRIQVNEDDTFADSTSASVTSASKKQHERQKLYKVLVDINAQMTADKVKIASIPGHDRDINRRIDRSFLDCEIINDLLGDLNRFHLDKQIHVLPKVLRLPAEFDRCLSMEGQFLFVRDKPIPLKVCSKLYVLKTIIEAVYEELSSPAITYARKLWLLRALGYLHTNRRNKLSELCHTEAQHVIDLAVLFHSRRAWYRKMQAEFQKSPRDGSAVPQLDSPLKYLDQRIASMTKYLGFIHELQKLTDGMRRPADLHMKDSYNGSPNVYSQPMTIAAHSTAPQLTADASAQDTPSEVKFQPSSESSTKNARYNIIRSVCLPKIEAFSGGKTETDGSVSDSRVKVDKKEVCLSETDDLCVKGTTDANEGGFFGDAGISENPVRDQNDTSKESGHDDERDFVTGCSPIDDGYDRNKEMDGSVEDSRVKVNKKEVCHSETGDPCERSTTDANEGGFFGDAGISENPCRDEKDTSKKSCHDNEHDFVTGCSPIDDGYDVITVGDESPTEHTDDAIDKSENHQTEMVCGQTDMVIVIDDSSDETTDEADEQTDTVTITDETCGESDSVISTSETCDQSDSVISRSETRGQTDLAFTTSETCDQSDSVISTTETSVRTDLAVATSETCDQSDSAISTSETRGQTDTNNITNKRCDKTDTVIATSETCEQTDVTITPDGTHDETDTNFTRNNTRDQPDLYDPFDTVITDDEMYDPFDTVIEDENYEQTDMDMEKDEDEADTNITTHETREQADTVVTADENRHKKEKKKVIRLLLGEESYSVFAGSQSRTKDKCVAPAAEQSDVDFVEGLNDLIIDMDEDFVSHDDDNNRGREQRDISDVRATSKHRLRCVDKDSSRRDDVGRIGVIMNGNEQLRSPEIRPIGVIVNIRASVPDAAPVSNNERPSAIRPVSEERLLSSAGKPAEKPATIRPVIEHRIGLRVPSSAEEPTATASRSSIEKRVIPRILSPEKETTAGQSLIEKRVISRIPSPAKEPTASRSLIENRVIPRKLSPENEPTASRSSIEKRVIPRILSPTKEPTSSRSSIEKRVPSSPEEPVASRSTIREKTQHKSPLKIASAIHRAPNAECETSKRKSPKSDVGGDSEKILRTNDSTVMQRVGDSCRGGQFNDRNPHKHSRGGYRYEVSFGPCYPEQNAFQDPAQRPCHMEGGQFGSRYHEQNAFQDSLQRRRQMEQNAFQGQRGRQMEQNPFHDPSQGGRQMEEARWSQRHNSWIWERERFGVPPEQQQSEPVWFDFKRGVHRVKEEGDNDPRFHHLDSQRQHRRGQRNHDERLDRYYRN